MPELPEVETIRLGLKNKIIGLKIKSIQILNPKSFIGESQNLVGKQIKSIFRKAKILGIEFEDIVLLIHLKMSGQLILQEKRGRDKEESFIGGHPTLDMHGELPNKSTRVIFELENLTLHPRRCTLYFNDQRKFGWIKVVTSNTLESDKFIKSLGPEPLEKEFSVKVLKEKVAKRNAPIKVLLLDQSIVSGIGNIYACEACFLAGIDPRKKASSLNDTEIKKLYQGIVKSLQNGIKYGGSSKTHFVNPEGKKGLFLDYARVYSRKNLPCKKCKTKIRKIKLGGRGTYFCPVCQH